MSKDSMEKLRDTVNTIISSDYYDRDFLVKKSQELDKLIVAEMKKSIFIQNVLGDRHLDIFDELLDKLESCEKSYDIMRIVDPIKNHVLKLKDGELEINDTKCFMFWNRNKTCDNCISNRAIIMNDVVIKMEHVNDKIYIIIAIPIEIRDKKLVVEVLKEISDMTCSLSENKISTLLRIDLENSLYNYTRNGTNGQA